MSQYEASRFITGAYLLLGDILNLSAGREADHAMSQEIRQTAAEDV